MRDPIIVYSVFRNGSIKPLSFMWKKRRIKVDSITMVWDTAEEDGINLHFSVISGEFYYHLLYKISLSSWYMLDIESTSI